MYLATPQVETAAAAVVGPSWDCGRERENLRGGWLTWDGK
ncbi:predicted protein [Chaetomium globosum CBS 148.51]|uniref:Uncharacterized protein n=1 Tax=Chaetomium globosum (strain ATCC 6205 / CBS 148.51 / DSM 1962 / NBRC 6347 / NRRL 1970) TaxID=306901 RepID=Q2HHZ7_CHAGB|nr:uncharacterized protein CHGG_00157 [Chaetomium globosum CBS 148.51]EAQ91922.1 predicted protein [Chaetomium globosum CBS 148.51]